MRGVSEGDDGEVEGDGALLGGGWGSESGVASVFVKTCSSSSSSTAVGGCAIPDTVGWWWWR